MKLFNKTIDRQLFKQYPLGSDLSKQEVVVKIFNPMGRGTWFILNSDPEDPDYLWAIVDLGYGAEVGSVGRRELEDYRSPLGWGFERDLSFEPVNAEELLKGLRKGEFYADGGGVENKIQIKNFADLKQGDVIRRKDKLGTTIFVVNKSPVQSQSYKNEYNALVTCIVSNTDFYKPYEEYYIASVIRYGKLGNVDYIGKRNHNDGFDYSIYLPKSNKKMSDGGEIEVVYERVADFKKKPIRLLLLNKGREQKGFTFSGKDQVAVLNNYNRNKQEDLEKLWNLKGYESKYANGGDIENFSDNQRMIMNQNVELEHHHEELEDILEDKVPVPAWVVAKMATATDSVSDVAHYLDGQKELIEDEYEEEEEDEDGLKNTEVVEPINVSAGTKEELTKKFTEDAWGNLRGFLKGMEGIDLRDDYTFDYKNEQYEIEPIINSDENGVSNAVFSIYNGDGEEVGEVAYSREGGKQKFTANSEFFSWNNAKFEDGGFMNNVYADGGYFDGTIPNVSSYMSTYANGGEIAKAEIIGLRKNILGTTDVEMKISGMRKPQEFSVYPISKDDTDKIITIQSSTRIGKIDLSTGRGLMSQSHSNGAYFVHFQMDRLIPFTVSEADLEDLKSHIFKTAGSDVGNSIIKSDNSGASRIFAKGGITYYNNENQHRLSRPKSDMEEVVYEKIKNRIDPDLFVGNFGWKTPMNKTAFGYLYALDDFDKKLVENVKLKQGEVIFRYVNRMTAIGGMMPLIKINIEKVLLYFPTTNEINEDEIVFETRGISPLWLSLIEGSFAKGGKIHLGDVVEVKEPNYGYDSTYYVVDDKAGYDGKNFLISDTRKRVGDVFEKEQLKKAFANGGGIGFIPMDLEHTLAVTSKWGGTDIKGVIGILNTMIDLGLTDEDLKPKPTKSGIAHQNAVEKKTKEIWDKIKPEYKGDLKGNMPYGTIQHLVSRSNTSDDVLKRYKPFRKYQKDSFADGGNITPALNDNVVKRAEELYIEMNGKTKEDFDKAYDKAVIEFGYSPDTFKRKMEKIGWTEDDGYESYAKGGRTKKSQVYINFLNKKKNFKEDIKYFDSYEEAVKWARNSFERFDHDMIKYVEQEVKPKYILKADIETVTVKRKGKELTYSGSDVLNGAHVLSNGGDITSKANYVGKNDVVEVKLKDGSTVKPVNGYWIKKDAEPISNEPTPTASVNSGTKIGETYIRKDSRGNWRAETNIDNFNDYDWRISTVKTYSGNLVSSAQGGKTKDSGTKGISMFQYTVYEDPNHTLEVSKPKRLTDKVVSEQHDKALAKFKKFMETGMFKGGGKISKFDKLSAKVAKEYEGKPVKSEYQEEYGRYYSREEAQEVGDKVAGKVKAMQSDKKAFGGLFGGVKNAIKPKTYANLDDTMVTTKDGRAVQVIDQSGDTLFVIDANLIGTGVRPTKMNISEIDPTSYKMGGKTARKRVNGGTETLKKANELAKKIRKDGESWFDAKKRAFAQLKNA